MAYDEESCVEPDPSVYLDEYLNSWYLFHQSMRANRTQSLTIKAALASNATQVSLSGRVTEAKDKKLVNLRNGGQKYVREFLLSDDEATIIVTLWDDCAQSAEIEVGDHLKVMHARLNYNTYHKQKVVHVDDPNQIVPQPASPVGSPRTWNNAKRPQPASPVRSPRTQNNAQRVRITQLLQTRDCANDSRILIAKVVALQAPVQKDGRVQKHRLRLVLADETDAILSFLTKPKPNWLKEGSDVLIVNYSCSKHTITINDRTALTMNGPVAISAAISDVARRIFSSPQAPVSTIQAVSALHGRPQVSVTGHVIQTEEKRITSFKSGFRMYVRDVLLSDHDGTITVTLWDASAAYAQIKVGDHLKVMDATLSYNNYRQENILTVKFLDQIVHLPSESCTIVGVSPAKRKRYE